MLFAVAVAGFGHSLFSIDRAALPGCRGQTRIRCDLRRFQSVGIASDQSMAANSGPMPLMSSNIAAGAGWPFVHSQQRVPARPPRS